MLGYVGFTALVVGLAGASRCLPAVIILSIMVVPYIAKTTENSLRQVPTGYREGAEALGMSAGYSLRKVVLKTRAAGHRDRPPARPGHRLRRDGAAPLHGGFSNTLPHSLTQPQFPYLTYVVFTFYDPSVQKHYLAYDAALILVVIVLLLLVASRIIVARTQRHSERARHPDPGAVGPPQARRRRPAPDDDVELRRPPHQPLSGPGVSRRSPGSARATRPKVRSTDPATRRNVERRT